LLEGRYDEQGFYSPLSDCLPVGSQLISIGHKASSAGGGIAGGYQGIMFVPNPEGGRMTNCDGNNDTECGVNGFYRAGSNFREDGDSIGW
jgi:gamma-glutamyltranspeptidase / glutathione hydrolase